MQPSQLNELMEQSAEDAVVTASQQANVTLDYSEGGLNLVDTAISEILRLFPDESQEDKSVFTICNIFGAYLGEVFKKHHGGEWEYNDTDANAPSIYLRVNDNTYAFAGICYEKLVKNPNVSVAKYYQQALNTSSK
ncbi:MAG: hypothetical protein AAGJ37_09090 [Pseudomonadota bacterium]